MLFLRERVLFSICYCLCQFVMMMCVRVCVCVREREYMGTCVPVHWNGGLRDMSVCEYVLILFSNHHLLLNPSPFSLSLFLSLFLPCQAVLQSPIVIDIMRMMKSDTDPVIIECAFLLGNAADRGMGVDGDCERLMMDSTS